METTTENRQEKVLIVGAGGFIGGFIAAEALKRGYDTYVGVRESTSRRYLTDSRLHFVVLDYDDEQSMACTLRESLPEGEKWTYIIYNLGATKCVNFADFNRINYLYLCNFIDALRETSMMPERFLYMSSLSAIGPGDEKNYTPLTSQSIPQPNTRYGVSKIKAETFLETCADVPWTIFRPTGVYGPHEKDYLMMIQSIDRHFDFGVGFRKQMLTFVYVEDLVNAMFSAITKPATLKKKYIISEPRAYSQKEFRKLTAELLGGRWVLPLRLPLWVVYAASVAAEKWGTFKGQPSTLNRDKFKIMKQRNWNCDVSDAVRDFGYTSKFSLREGLRKTVEAYLEQKEAGEGQNK
ncbi:MAG: NAD(P)-dependent oxidoreductase [Firmicutes bacterium]|nr:NAD(P)-dependent oxidoreductase [Bacillota bacterium]MCM1400574.1 NAD(P)-dependent oxidoreductase [Bacteroides sp.]MCM1476478.1 NAD(P)-dependent oxidoreductase [Bacteroides sp.]